MKDLDFDELDRAVNSLMKDAPATDPEPKLADEQTVTINPTIKEGDKPSLANLSQAVSHLNGPTDKADAVSQSSTPPGDLLPKPDPVPTPVSNPKKQPVSVASRRGRFMDVRPGTTKPETPVRRQSREGIAIDPTRPIVNDVIRPMPNTAPPKEVVTETEPVSDVKADPVSVVNPVSGIDQNTDEHTKEDWPDPIEMAGYEESELPAKKPETDKKTEAETPLVSPFLPDAKVEKRPLGGQPSSAPPATPELSAIESDEAMAAEDTAQLMPNPVVEKPLPEELSGDVIALESDANTMTQPTSTEEPVAAQREEEPAPEAMITASSATSKPVASPPSTGAISIPQQYKEEPSSGDKSSGSIYDTDTYHQPLTHPGKKKSGWMWVIWIVLILILGAGAGAALYYFKVF